MKRLIVLSVLLLVFAGLSVNAQITPFRGDVEVIELSPDSTFVFQVTCSSLKKDELKTLAEKTVLYALLFDGVEGVNDDEKLVHRENRKYFENFFYTKDKLSPHQRFILGTQLEGKPAKQDNEEFKATFSVSVKYKALCREMRLQKLTDPNAVINKDVQNSSTNFN